LLLLHNKGFSQLQIVSRSLRSICVDSRYFHQGSIQQLVIEDAPCLERLLYLGGTQMNITYLHQGWLFWGNSLTAFPGFSSGPRFFRYIHVSCSCIVDHFHLHEGSKLNPFLPINHDVLILACLTQGSAIVSTSGGVVSSVKVLALYDVKLCLHAVINLLQCFPHLQKLYIEVSLRTRVCLHLHSFVTCRTSILLF
jgi:hypothetical protein